jgi:hypothetical protein
VLTVARSLALLLPALTEFKTDDGRATSTLYFLYWVPQNSNQVDKILISSAKTNFVACLEGFKAVSLEQHARSLMP